MVTIADSPVAESARLVDLAVRRYRHFNRSELAAVYENPALFPQQQAFGAVREDGLTVGMGEWSRPVFFPAGRIAVRIAVSVGHEGLGTGTALRNAIFDTLPPETTTISTVLMDDDPRSLDIARHWGFTVESHPIRAEVALDAIAWPTLDHGVTVDDCSDLTFPDPADVEAMLAASHTDPDAAAGMSLTLRDLAARVGDGVHPVGALLRVDGRPAALTCGVIEDQALMISYTGVDPQYRGRGLGRLIKLWAHAQASERGAQRSVTYNEEHNTPIRRINTMLGYTVRFGYYRMVRPAPSHPRDH